MTDDKAKACNSRAAGRCACTPATCACDAPALSPPVIQNCACGGACLCGPACECGSQSSTRS